MKMENDNVLCLLDINKRNLVLTYRKWRANYIKSSMTKKQLKETTVITFDEYIHNSMILPYLPSINKVIPCIDGIEPAKIVLSVKWLVQKVIKRTNMFYDIVIIDGFDNFTKNECKLIGSMSNGLTKIERTIQNENT